METFTTRQLINYVFAKTGQKLTPAQVCHAVQRNNLTCISAPGMPYKITRQAADKFLTEWQQIEELEQTGWILTATVKQRYGDTPTGMWRKQGHGKSHLPYTCLHRFSRTFWKEKDMDVLFSVRRADDWEPKKTDQCLYALCTEKAVDKAPYGFRFCPRHMVNLNKVRARQAQKTAFTEIAKLANAVTV